MAAGTDLEPGAGEKLGDRLFLLVEAEGLDGGGEVLDRVELAVANDDSDSDDVDLGVKQVLAMPFGVHPELVEDRGAGGLGHVFADQGEACAGPGSALGEIGLARELVSDVGVGGHLERVKASGFGEDRIEAKRRDSAGGAIAIRRGEETLLDIDRGARQRVRDGCGDCETGSGCQVAAGRRCERRDSRSGLAPMALRKEPREA